eukprot:scaffold289740_cov38-Attheya_sp.AAC.1
MEAIRCVLQAKLSNPAPVPFIFESTVVAAIEGNPKSPLSYGSEFRPTSIIECLFRRYPLWDRLVHILDFGVDCLLTPTIDPEISKLNLVEALEKGNSKGAQANPEVMEDLIKGDVQHGVLLGIPRDKIMEIIGAQVAPMNVANQNSIN